jgi:hypothetical protein
VQSSRWRLAFFVTAGVSLPLIAFLVYGIIDQAVTITYMSQGYEDTIKDLEVLASAFPRDRYNKKDIVVVLRRENPDAFIVESACSVQLNGVRFDFNKNGSLSAINSRAQYTEERECDN